MSFSPSLWRTGLCNSSAVLQSQQWKKATQAVIGRPFFAVSFGRYGTGVHGAKRGAAVVTHAEFNRDGGRSRFSSARASGQWDGGRSSGGRELERQDLDSFEVEEPPGSRTTRNRYARDDRASEDWRRGQGHSNAGGPRKYNSQDAQQFGANQRGYNDAHAERFGGRPRKYNDSDARWSGGRPRELNAEDADRNDAGPRRYDDEEKELSGGRPRRYWGEDARRSGVRPQAYRDENGDGYNAGQRRYDDDGRDRFGARPRRYGNEDGGRSGGRPRAFSDEDAERYNARPRGYDDDARRNRFGARPRRYDDAGREHPGAAGQRRYASEETKRFGGRESRRGAGAEVRWKEPRPADIGLEKFDYFVTCAPGLEDVVAAELGASLVGAVSVRPGKAGVYFQGSLATGYRASLWLRTGIRVLVKLAEADLPTSQAAGDSVYEFIRTAAPWPELLCRGGFRGRRGGGENGRPGMNEVYSGVGVNGKIREKASWSQRKDGTWGWVPRDGSSSAEEGDSEAFAKLTGGMGESGQGGFWTFSVESRVWDCSTLSSSQLATRRAKDAICDAMRDACGGLRPDPPSEGAWPDLPLYLSLYQDHAVLYRDMCGASLHKRGYRDPIIHKASLNECIAAGILTLAGWNPMVRIEGGGAGAQRKTPLHRGLPAGTAVEEEKSGGGEGPRVLMDPMCGSGTLLIEAALMSANRAPGLLRRQWPFETWPDHKPDVWAKILDEAEAMTGDPSPYSVRLLGNDVHPGALALCERGAQAAGVRHLITLSNDDVAVYQPPARPSFVITNPPWGDRLGGPIEKGEADSLVKTWIELGLFFKRHCGNLDVFVLSGNSDVTRELCMKVSRKWPLTTGGIDCRLLKYHVLPPKATAQ